MKKRNWLYLILIALCLGAFLGYRAIDRINTDRQAPVITFSGETLELSVSEPVSAFLQGVTATDHIDGDVTASLVVESVGLADSSGTVNVTYAAFDAAGNVSKAERQARYTDYESPRFSLSKSLTFTEYSGFDIFQIVSVEDLIEGDISHRIRITSLDESPISARGTHEVELRVSNSLGETVKLILPVEVYPAGTYDAVLELTDYLVYLPAGSDFDAQSFLYTFTGSGGKVSLTSGLPSAYTLRTEGTVDTDTPGVYSVEYRVTKTDGEILHTGYAKLIVVVEEG